MTPVLAGLLVGVTMAGTANRAAAAPVADSQAPAPAPALTYADLVDLAQQAPLVFSVQVHDVAVLEPERAHGVRPGWARIYVESRPLAALHGPLPAAKLVGYLADVPLSAKGKPPALKKQTMLLLARVVPDQPATVQLVAPDAQLADSPALEARLHEVLAALGAPDAPAVIAGVREAIYVPGTLEGAGETQIFLATASGEPASISVEHRPGQSVSWSVSFSEVVDASGQPPAHDTLAWYRLACALPPALPQHANISDGPENRARAEADYALVLAGLGPCTRSRAQ